MLTLPSPSSEEASGGTAGTTLSNRSCWGRDLDHFADDAERLARATPEAIVDARALGTQLAAWLEDPALRGDILARQRAALPCSQEIAARYLAALAPWLDGRDRGEVEP